MKLSHESIEINAGLMIVLTLIAISIGGLVEIVPLFYIKDTIEKVEGVRPYTPLEQRGRDIYIREGCYTCHSQMIRPFRDEHMRYGHYSLAAESKYDHPFQWGSKRTGPDLARVGGKYSNEWHVAHLVNPRDVVPESIMPAYPHLQETTLDFEHIADHLKAQRAVGVPYTDEMVLVVSNATSQDYALVWNGSSWGNAQVLASDGTGTAEAMARAAIAAGVGPAANRAGVTSFTFLSVHCALSNTAINSVKASL